MHFILSQFEIHLYNSARGVLNGKEKTKEKRKRIGGYKMKQFNHLKIKSYDDDFDDDDSSNEDSYEED